MMYKVKSYEECLTLLKNKNYLYIWLLEDRKASIVPYPMHDPGMEYLLKEWESNWASNNERGNYLYITNMSYHEYIGRQSHDMISLIAWGEDDI